MASKPQVIALEEHGDVKTIPYSFVRQQVDQHRDLQDIVVRTGAAGMIEGSVQLLPAVDGLVKVLAANGIVHRVSTWGNQLALRVYMAWRWGELVIMQSHEDCVTFEHHIITEGEKRGDDSAEDHSHQYDLRDPLPATLASAEIQFFLSRVAQDLVEPEPEPEIPPGEEVPPA